MATNNIELSIKVNAETGQLEILGSKFDALNTKAKEASGSFLGLTGEAAKLAKQMLPFATGAGALLFFKSAVEGAEASNEAFRRLQFTMAATGQSWTEQGKRIEAWTRAIAAATRFTDSEAITALDRLARSTKTVSQAEAAAELAMGVSVATGKNLAESTDLVNGLLNKQARAVQLSHKEFGTLVEKATSAQEVLDVLNATYGKAAIDSKSLTDETSKLHNQWEQVKDTIGNALIPVVSSFLDFLLHFRQNVTELRIVFVAEFETILVKIKGVAVAFYDLAHGNIGAVRGAFQQMNDEVATIAATMHQELQASQTAQTATVMKHSQERLQVTSRLNDEELSKRKEMLDRAQDLEAQMAQNIANIGKDSTKKKQVQLDEEIAARRKKITREITDETLKAKLLEKLDFEKFQRSAAIDKADLEMKRATTFETLDLAFQTLGILNSLGNSHNKAEVNRAKAILALEKTIAIARAISAAMAAPPGIAQALAVAQVAFVGAQFAQQYKAIDSAAAAYKSGQSSVSVSTPLDSGGVLTRSSGAGGVVLPDLGGAAEAAAGVPSPAEAEAAADPVRPRSTSAGSLSISISPGSRSTISGR
jgi:hypothetical protein